MVQFNRASFCLILTNICFSRRLVILPWTTIHHLGLKLESWRQSTSMLIVSMLSYLFRSRTQTKRISSTRQLLYLLSVWDNLLALMRTMLWMDKKVLSPPRSSMMSRLKEMETQLCRAILSWKTYSTMCLTLIFLNELRSLKQWNERPWVLKTLTNVSSLNRSLTN